MRVDLKTAQSRGGAESVRRQRYREYAFTTKLPVDRLLDKLLIVEGMTLLQLDSLCQYTHLPLVVGGI